VSDCFTKDYAIKGHSLVCSLCIADAAWRCHPRVAAGNLASRLWPYLLWAGLLVLVILEYLRSQTRGGSRPAAGAYCVLWCQQQ
ncbi:hypothetical protein, partial [Candidatus Erwinia dacicola]